MINQLDPGEAEEDMLQKKGNHFWLSLILKRYGYVGFFRSGFLSLPFESFLFQVLPSSGLNFIPAVFS